jgi:iron complex outermembrane receptor protein
MPSRNFKSTLLATPCVAFIALCAAPSALAQATTTSERDIVVVTGAKTDGGEFGGKSGIPLEQVPQAVQVLDAQELLERNVRSVGDALKAIPSASIGTPRTSAYQSFSLKVRGFYVDQMRNGMRQRYYEDVDASAISNVERIEVLKGPSSILFGHSAVGGIVSIVTKRPQREFGGSVSAVVGSFDQKSAAFDVTGPLSKEAGLYFRATGEVERSGTYVDFQDIDRENAALSLTWEASDSVTAYFVSEWQERRTQRNPGLPIVGTVVSNGVAEVPSETFLGDPGHSDLEAFSPLFQTWVDFELNDTWTLTPRLSYSELDTNFTQLRVRAVDADGVTVNRNGRFGKEDDNYTIAQVDLTGSISLAGMTHNLLTGVEYDRERSTFYQENLTSVPSINALNPTYGAVADRPYPFAFVSNSDIDGWAIYAQDRIDVTDRWNVVLGARWSTFDTHSEFSTDPVIDPADITDDELDHSTFQIGTTYRLDGGWSIFGGFATGFDMENVAGGRSANGSPFDPEESEQIEAGARYVNDIVSGSASVFEIKRTNVLTDDPNNIGFSIQTGEVRVRGLELEGAWQIIDGLSLQAGYAWMDGEVTSSNTGNEGFDLADTPEHQANMFVRYDVPGLPVQLRAGVNYVGDRAFSDSVGVAVFPGLLANNVTLPAYTSLDLGATYDFGAARLDLAITNVTDETYYTREFNDFSVFPGEPLQASLRLTADF